MYLNIYRNYSLNILSTYVCNALQNLTLEINFEKMPFALQYKPSHVKTSEYVRRKIRNYKLFTNFLFHLCDILLANLV